jgi:transposase
VGRLVRFREDQWSRIEPLLPPATRTGGRDAKPHRRMVEAMVWVLRTGAPWRDLPPAYGPWQSVYTRWSRWSASGVMASLLAALSRERDGESFLIDATIVRAHQDASGARKKGGSQEIGRSRGGPSTKIHAIVDALGNPVRLELSPGQTHEMKLAPTMLADIRDANVIGDRAYDAKALADQLAGPRCRVVIPSNPTRASPRAYDKDLYLERCLVEHFFQRIKRFRRIAMRFEKLAKNFLAFVQLAAVRVWLLERIVGDRRALGPLAVARLRSSPQKHVREHATGPWLLSMYRHGQRPHRPVGVLLDVPHLRDLASGRPPGQRTACRSLRRFVSCPLRGIGAPGACPVSKPARRAPERGAHPREQNARGGLPPPRLGLARCPRAHPSCSRRHHRAVPARSRAGRPQSVEHAAGPRGEASTARSATLGPRWQLSPLVDPEGRCGCLLLRGARAGGRLTRNGASRALTGAAPVAGLTAGVPCPLRTPLKTVPRRAR